MKRTTLQNRGWGAFVASAVTTLFIGTSAFAQYSPPPAGSISIPDFPGLPTAYPSKIKVENVKGTLEKVSVTLNTVTHSYANDLSVMLVAPNGDAIVLMSDAGGGQPIGGATLVFDDNGGILPRFAAIGSGSYYPTNYAGTGLTNAPTANSSKLSELTDSDPNGDWSLYVVDDAAFNSGSIGSWTVNLYTTPFLEANTNRIHMAENTPATPTFGTATITVTDNSTPVNTLKFSVGTTNSALLPASGIKVTGSGNTRTLTVTPVNYLSGTNYVTVTAEDELGGRHTLYFKVEVEDVNQKPVLSFNTNTVYVAAGNVASNLTAFLTDLDFPAANTLALSVTSSDPNIVNAAGVGFGTTPPFARPVYITPSITGAGAVTLTFTVNDGTTASDPVAVTVNVLPSAQPLFANTNTLALPVTTPAASRDIAVSGVSGLIGKVEVALKGVQNLSPDGAVFTLTAPGGTTVNLFPTSTEAGPVDMTQLTFADGATGVVPSTDVAFNVVLAPAEALSKLANLNPNGTWSLSVQNAGADANAKAVLGWQLKIFTAPVVGAISDVSFLEDGSGSVAFAVGDADGAVASVHPIMTDPSLAQVISTNLSGTTATLTIAGKQNAFGTNTVQVVAVDNNGFRGTNTFTLRIAAQNDAPDISFIEKQVTYAGQPVGPVAFTISDVDNDVDDLDLTVTSSNPKILPEGNVFLQRNGGTVTMLLFPTGTAAGESFVTIRVSDGALSDSSSFQFYLQSPANPLYLSPSGPITITANSPATPYPATNQVTGLVGRIAEVQVTLFGFTHQQPTNLNVVLMAPNGDALVLMQNSGGTNQVNNLTLVFGDSATNHLNPTNIVSGIYRAVDGLVNFPPPPPVGVTVWGSFTQAFNGDDPNGTWKLYVFDDGTDKSNGVIDGWMLSIRTGPNITAIPDTVMNENTPKCIDVTVGDVQPGVTFTVIATNSGPAPENLALIPNANIGITEKGATRTLCFTNAPYKYGSTTITVVATDNLGNSSVDTFTLTVQRVNLPPVVSSIADQTTPAAVAKTVQFTAWSPQFDAASPTNKVTVNSDNPTLVPNQNISVRWVSQADLPDRPDTDTFELTVLPAGIQTGSANISVTVTDAANEKTTRTFKLTVTPSLVFAYEKPIAIPLGAPIAGEGQPYPALIPVSGIEGLVDKVSLTLSGFTHSFPEDVSVLLVSHDDSKAVMVMSHAGGTNDASNLRLTFTDAATVSLPDGTDGTGLFSGTFDPSSYAPSIILPPPAPQSSPATAMSAFAGLPPNGNWKVYVYDDAFPDGGEIAGGALLFIETKPAFGPIAKQTTPENVPILVPFNVFNSTVNPSNLTFTASRVSGDSFLAPTFAFEGFGSSRFLWITNAANQPSLNKKDTVANGNAKIRITATAPNGVANSTEFDLEVVYVNQAPQFTATPGTIRIPEYTNSSTAGTPIVWKVRDVDSKLNLANSFVFYASDSTLFPKDNVTAAWSPSAPDFNQEATITVTAKPALHKFGTNTITVALKDKENHWITNAAVVEVFTQPMAPLITAATLGSGLSTNVNAGDTKAFAFNVGSTEVGADSIVVWATSSADLYVPDSYVATSGSGSNRTVRVTAVGEVAGSTIITLWATDGTLTNSLDFTLAVNADTSKSLYADTTGITLNGTNLPSAYPSIITVPPGTFGGKIAKVAVTLDGLTHTSPANLDVMLVGPDGATAVMLMSGAGDALPVSNPIRLTFDDGASAPLPTGQLTGGTFRPTSYTKNTPPNAPSKYAVDLAAFNGLDPNGQWRLFVYNNGANGSILAGWRLNITTGPIINVTGTDLNVDENEAATIEYSVSDDYGTASDKFEVSATSSNPGLLPVKNINLGGNASLTRIATLSPELYQSGESTITLTVKRTTDNYTTTTTDSYVLRVTPRNIAPTISRLDDIIMNANEQTATLFLVFDGDTRLEDLDIQAGAEDPTIVSTNSLLFFGKNNPQTNGLPASAVPNTSIVSLSIDPNDAANGTTKVWVTVSDTNSLGSNYISKSFWLTVNRFSYPPVVSDIPPQFVASGGSLNNIGFTVTSPVSSTFNVTATSTDTTLVPTLQVTHGSGNNWTLALTTADIVAGPESRQATITVTATDTSVTPNVSSSKSFVLTVLPPRERSYTNNSPITITDNSAASLYPSPIKVSDLLGSVSKVTVRLHGFSHFYPDDVGVLLVGPGGQKVVLMNRAGGAGDVFGANIKFDQQALTPIPDVGTISSGIYSPADYRGGSYDFPAPAPTGAYQTTLDAFNGGPASGTWSLYVYDAVLGDAGIITNGWSIAITTQPIMSGLTNFYTLEDAPVTQPFTILDDSRTTPNFTFTKTSSKTDVVPVNNIAITPVGSSGMDFNVTVTPAKFGSNVVITIGAVNADGQSVQKSFTVDVGYKATAPIVGALANANMLAGTVLSVPVIYYDAHTPTNQLKIGLNSSDTSVVPAGNLKMVGTNLVIAPIGNATGLSTISVSVTNNDSLVTTVSFDLTVDANPGVFADSSKITINDAARATPSPSVISVAGLSSVTDVNVTLGGFSHTFPQDVSILLVSPTGQGVVLMSRAGGSAPVSNVRLVFDDSAATALPSTGTFGDGAYRPADYKSVDFFSGAPAGPYAKVLSAFNGLSPNGTWSLYVQDDAAQDAGAINQGWALNITTSSGKTVFVGGRGPSLTIGQTAEGMQLNLSGIPNVDYAIQSSSDLTNWSDAGTVTSDDEGKAVYSVQSGQAPALFFRALAR